jgi:hypothetical protein
VQATASGLYIAEKIDLLVAYVIAQPLGNLLVKYFPQVSCTCNAVVSAQRSLHRAVAVYRRALCQAPGKPPSRRSHCPAWQSAAAWSGSTAAQGSGCDGAAARRITRRARSWA